MNNIIQIISLLFSFIFGFLYFYLVNLNYYLNKDNKTFIKYLNNTIFTLDVVLLYTIINYKINGGYFHIYFIIMIALGFFSANCTLNSVKSTIYKLKIKK